MTQPIDPIVLRLSSIVDELGTDVSREDRGTALAFSRGRLFALLEPQSPTRLDLALVLPGADETERLRPVDDGGEPAAVTHRVSLAHEDEIDGELTEWLRAAYDAATPSS